MRKPARVLVHYRLPPDLLDRLAARATRERKSKTAIVERALRRELARKKGGR
jgi:predicted transcriptional regulator